ncbi:MULTISPECIES: hypothetical protein [unclassified Streptomyces]|uniref:hypothetical protein n=1 Tax=unclassified Streptomyces TaxID=2593676 RepID=UPI00131A0029|nr:MULTISPECIES: hypothetical protein [unclassified Streptomyces]MYX34253.1 hypothetical protein [Streptomyces sp. SID8377]
MTEHPRVDRSVGRRVPEPLGARDLADRQDRAAAVLRAAGAAGRRASPASGRCGGTTSPAAVCGVPAPRSAGI